MLAQFGHATNDESDEELLSDVSEFALEQTRSWQAPVLIVDNVDRMYPSTLRLLNTLAALAVHGGASIIRAHDVKATRRAVDLAWAVCRAEEE